MPTKARLDVTALIIAVRSEYAVPPNGARFSQRCNPETPGQEHRAITSPPAQTPGTVFIINMENNGSYSRVGSLCSPVVDHSSWTGGNAQVASDLPSSWRGTQARASTSRTRPGSHPYTPAPNALLASTTAQPRPSMRPTSITTAGGAGATASNCSTHALAADRSSTVSDQFVCVAPLTKVGRACQHATMQNKAADLDLPGHRLRDIHRRVIRARVVGREPRTCLVQLAGETLPSIGRFDKDGRVVRPQLRRTALRRRSRPVRPPRLAVYAIRTNAEPASRHVRLRPA